MIGVDTNCLIAYLAGDQGKDMEFLDKLLERKAVALPPVVLSELLSDPALPADMEKLMLALPSLAPLDGYWARAGKLRAELSRHGFSARLADTLVAQSCLDHNAPLLTRDKGFAHFNKVAGLELLQPGAAEIS